MNISFKKGYMQGVLFCVILENVFTWPWLYSGHEIVFGTDMIKNAFHFNNVMAIFGMLLIINTLAFGWYSMMVTHNKIFTLICSIIGIISCLHVVDFMGQELVKVTGESVSRGIGNYILLIAYGFMVFSVLQTPIKRMLEDSRMMEFFKLDDMDLQ